LSRELHVPKILNENARDNTVKGSLDIEEDGKDEGPLQKSGLNSISKGDEVINT